MPGKLCPIIHQIFVKLSVIFHHVRFNRSNSISGTIIFQINIIFRAQWFIQQQLLIFNPTNKTISQWIWHLLWVWLKFITHHYYSSLWLIFRILEEQRNIEINPFLLPCVPYVKPNMFPFFQFCFYLLNFRRVQYSEYSTSWVLV